ncbi:hypothetical protein QJS10_CPB18g02002 [Acorus calamus]|uniref:SCS-beta n=1 Tax=Acorus calamus TaxID=4465 RepID=A0AAV9CPG8_ACOCL|nr:hypothetical protein QJS10_CPB18g02002 [Acorus calamus]
MESSPQKSLERVISQKALRMSSSSYCKAWVVGFLCGACIAYLFLVGLSSFRTLEFGVVYSASAPEKSRNYGSEDISNLSPRGDREKKLGFPSNPNSRVFPIQRSLVMVRGLVRNLGSRSLTIAGRWQQQQLRRINIHEYQGTELMSKHGINVPKGVSVSSMEEIKKAIRDVFPDEKELVVKSQILASGRGLGTFKNGFQGGVHIVKSEKVEDVVGKMLGQILITKQTGPQGKVVSKILEGMAYVFYYAYFPKYAAQYRSTFVKSSLINEMYFAITLDRTTAGPVPIDVFNGITDEDAAKVVDGLAPKVADREASIEQINPIAETSDNQLVAADAKLNFDDNAAFRHKDIFSLRDSSQEDPREVAAAKADLNYISLDGEIGCMVNGAGLAMATMDIIKLHGGTPANFLDVDGNASENQVVEAFKILTADDKVKAILVNIFGGIMKCDVIASGIVNAAKQVALKVPVIVRLEGTNVDQGKKVLKDSGMTLITAEDLDDAAEKAVKAISAN